MLAGAKSAGFIHLLRQGKGPLSQKAFSRMKRRMHCRMNKIFNKKQGPDSGAEISCFLLLWPKLPKTIIKVLNLFERSFQRNFQRSTKFVPQSGPWPKSSINALWECLHKVSTLCKPCFWGCINPVAFQLLCSLCRCRPFQDNAHKTLHRTPEMTGDGQMFSKVFKYLRDGSV